MNVRVSRGAGAAASALMTKWTLRVTKRAFGLTRNRSPQWEGASEFIAIDADVQKCREVVGSPLSRREERVERERERARERVFKPIASLCPFSFLPQE